MKSKIAILQLKIPHYRRRLFSALCEAEEGIEIFHSSQITDDGIVDSISFNFPNNYIEMIEIGGFQYQKLLGNFFLKKYEYIVLGLELKIISNFFVAIGGLLRNIKIIWWCHGYNVHIKEKNYKFYLDRLIKSIFMKIGFKILLYTKFNYDELIANGVPAEKIIILNNTIDEKEFAFVSTKQITKNFFRETSTDNPTLTLIGRLTIAKKVYELIDLLAMLKVTFPKTRALIIGDGPEHENLRKYAVEKNVEESVIFYGTINDPEDIAPILLKADFMVNPGAVGLNIVTSYIFGIPYITLKDAKHGPEIEYLKSDYNGYLANTISDICEWIVKNYSDKKRYAELRSNCLKTIQNNIKFDYFVDNFLSAFK